jgi:hypothetical protein
MSNRIIRPFRKSNALIHVAVEDQSSRGQWETRLATTRCGQRGYFVGSDGQRRKKCPRCREDKA